MASARTQFYAAVELSIRFNFCRVWARPMGSLSSVHCGLFACCGSASADQQRAEASRAAFRLARACVPCRSLRPRKSCRRAASHIRQPASRLAAPGRSIFVARLPPPPQTFEYSSLPSSFLFSATLRTAFMKSSSMTKSRSARMAYIPASVHTFRKSAALKPSASLTTDS